LTNRELIAIYGFVIMPNHVHIICEMLEKNKKEMPNSNFTKFTAHCFKKDLAQYYPQVLSIFKSEKYDRQYQFWQRDALAVKIISKQMLLQKLEYIHLNPLSERWNLAKSPEGYIWSSAKYYEKGIDEHGFVKHFADRF
jgi:putative transposase